MMLFFPDLIENFFAEIGFLEAWNANRTSQVDKILLKKQTKIRKYNVFRKIYVSVQKFFL